VDGLGAWERDGEAVGHARLALPETGEGEGRRQNREERWWGTSSICSSDKLTASQFGQVLVERGQTL